jgi:hypothetical protein
MCLIPGVGGEDRAAALSLIPLYPVSIACGFVVDVCEVYLITLPYTQVLLADMAHGKEAKVAV